MEPWGRDQPSVAARAEALGVAEVIHLTVPSTRLWDSIGRRVRHLVGLLPQRQPWTEAHLDAPPFSYLSLIDGGKEGRLPIGTRYQCPSVPCSARRKGVPSDWKASTIVTRVALSAFRACRSDILYRSASSRVNSLRVIRVPHGCHSLHKCHALLSSAGSPLTLPLGQARRCTLQNLHSSKPVPMHCLRQRAHAMRPPTTSAPHVHSAMRPNGHFLRWFRLPMARCKALKDREGRDSVVQSLSCESCQVGCFAPFQETYL